MRRSASIGRCGRGCGRRLLVAWNRHRVAPRQWRRLPSCSVGVEWCWGVGDDLAFTAPDQSFRCSGVPVFRCSGVPVFRCSGGIKAHGYRFLHKRHPGAIFHSNTWPSVVIAERLSATRQQGPELGSGSCLRAWVRGRDEGGVGRLSVASPVVVSAVLRFARALQFPTGPSSSSDTGRSSVRADSLSRRAMRP
jgi:hypothetical protein